MSTPRICIVPSPAESAIVLSLQHPRNSISTRFVLHTTRGLCEIKRIPTTISQPLSWLLVNPDRSGHVVSDGSSHIFTPYDPLFLLLPHLLAPGNASKESHFVPIDDILDSLPENEWAPLLKQGSVSRRHIEARIRAVSDSVNLGEELAFRISQDKVLHVLTWKCEKMADGGLPKSMEDEFVTKVLAKPVAIAVEETTENEEPKQLPTPPESFTDTPPVVPEPTYADDGIKKLLRLQIAMQFLSASYLPGHLEELLAAHLTGTHDFAALDAHLAELKKLRAEAATVRSGDFNLKRGLDVEEAADERAKKRKQEEEEKKKKKNVSRGVQNLSKVNTRGMAKMTSFFKKKQPA